LAQNAIPRGERDLVNNFLKRFVLPSDSVKKENEIDISLALKSLPSKIDVNNFYRCEIIFFENIMLALIAYQNSEEDQLFKFYDDRNKKRLTKLLSKASITKDLTATLKMMGSSVLSILTKQLTLGR